MEEIKEKALLVGVNTGEEENFDGSMEELARLAEACEMEIVGIMTQNMKDVNKTFYIGSGKVEELKEYVDVCEADIILFDNSLTPSQIRNLQKELEKPIMDRTALILEIFASRAKTREAKLQVESATLQYMLPRLVGMHEALSRQGGASGSKSSKGAGEKKLELDRRKIEHRISELKKELVEVAKGRDTQRKKRMSSRIPQVALVGYTNAGKSTIMNRMVDKYGESSEKKVLEKDMLFATLETYVRNIDTADNKPFFLVDTVGFIHKLPHGLVKAFHSTLEEVKYADLLIQVVDYSDEGYKQQIEVTNETLNQLEAGDIPMIYVYNKADKNIDKQTDNVALDKEIMLSDIPIVKENKIFMSAVNSVGIDELIELIKSRVYADTVDKEFIIPYNAGGVLSYFMENATVLNKEFCEDGVHIKVNCYKSDAEKYKTYASV